MWNKILFFIIMDYYEGLQEFKHTDLWIININK